eukprot:12919353-Prorocentrum_lima.AAC.1
MNTGVKLPSINLHLLVRHQDLDHKANNTAGATLAATHLRGCVRCFRQVETKTKSSSPVR